MRENTLQTKSAFILLGVKVITPQGEKLGEIEDLVLDLEAGCVAYAVLSFGGFPGSSFIALPWETLVFDMEQEAFVLDVDRRMLDNAPGFYEDHWPETSDRTFIDEVYQYYGYVPYYEYQDRRHAGAFTLGASARRQ